MAQNNKEIDRKEYQYDNRFGVLVLLISYCGLGLFMVYKVAELLLNHIK